MKGVVKGKGVAAGGGLDALSSMDFCHLDEFIADCINMPSQVPSLSSVFFSNFAIPVAAVMAMPSSRCNASTSPFCCFEAFMDACRAIDSRRDMVSVASSSCSCRPAT